MNDTVLSPTRLLTFGTPLNTQHFYYTHLFVVRRRPRNFTDLPTLRRGDRLCWLPRPSRSWPSSIRHILVLVSLYIPTSANLNEE